MAKLDPILQQVADGARGRPSLYDLAPAEARAAFDARVLARPRERPAGMGTEDVVLPHGRGLALRIYRPADTAIGATIVFLHGGGYMLGGLDQMDGEAAAIAEAVQSVVVAVDYRLAPENKLPAAFDDAVAALEWALANAAQLGGDPALVAIAGESAGANIAASAAIEMRNRGHRLAGQLLIVPGPDFAAIAALDDRLDHPLLPAANLHKIARIALPEGQGGRGFPYSAMHADDLADLPPAVIGVAGHCPTVDIGVAYAERLREHGNEVRLFRFDDMFHPFFAFIDVSPAARQAAGQLLTSFADLLSINPAGMSDPQGASA